jgi:hypothetical protein
MGVIHIEYLKSCSYISPTERRNVVIITLFRIPNIPGMKVHTITNIA